MIHLPAVIISGKYTLPDGAVHILKKEMSDCFTLSSVKAILNLLETDQISRESVYFVDIHLVPMFLMVIPAPKYLVAISQNCDQILNNEHIKDYLYLSEYPKIEAQLHRILRNMASTIERRSFNKEIERLYEVGSYLSTKRSVDALIDAILDVSMELIGAEAGSFYSIVDSRTGKWSYYKKDDPYKVIQFDIAKNKRADLEIVSMTFPIVPTTIVGSSIILGRTIVIDDVHNIPKDAPYTYDAQVEKKTGYACKSMLTIPMMDKRNRILGAIQLINKYSGPSLSVFNKRDEDMMQFLSHYATIALENSHLYEEMNELLSDYEKIIQSIDLEKSGPGDELSKLTETIEMNPSALIITNTEGSILYANKQFETLTGYRSDEVIGKRPSFLNSGEMPPEHFKDFWNTILSGQEWRGEFHNRRKDGTLYWEKSSVTSVKDENNQIKFFVNTREDITDLKNTQSVLIQKEKNAAIGQLAAGMAHEINNPLGFITSNVSTLSDYSETLINTMEQVEQDKDAVVDFIHSSDYEFIKSDHTDLVQETLEGLTRVKKLVEAMRSYSSIDTLSEKIEFDLVEVAQNVLTIFSSLAADTCPVAFVPKTEAKVYGDSGKLQRVLMNILINALEAVKRKGSGDISMHLVDSKTNVILSIEDGGDGILPENIGHIFNPFFTTKPIGEGAGLGLSQALSIIKTDFNGHIDVTSTPDVGSEFTIVLPVSEHE
ncbi:PAS domain S-box protein [Fusibacter sp. JL216-2]|uniref:PAS domain S-box protein n=1 Tax=Fusibacter sp. JL216-2 TaxID=3071453 RepID=UPI003D3290F3